MGSPNEDFPAPAAESFDWFIHGREKSKTWSDAGSADVVGRELRPGNSQLGRTTQHAKLLLAVAALLANDVLDA